MKQGCGLETGGAEEKVWEQFTLEEGRGLWAQKVTHAIMNL